MFVKKTFIVVFLLALTSCGHYQKKEIPDTLGVHHVGLSVKSLDLTTDFFVKVLRFKVVHENPEYPARFVSDGSVMVTLWQVDKKSSPVEFNRKKNIGLHHLALRVGSFEKLDELFQRVKAWPGVKVQFAPELMAGGPGMHSIFYEPGGIRIELTHSPN